MYMYACAIKLQRYTKVKKKKKLSLEDIDIPLAHTCTISQLPDFLPIVYSTTYIRGPQLQSKLNT